MQMSDESRKPLIEFDRVSLGYRGRVVLSDLDFAIHENEFFGIVGANGSGKTTILRAMLGSPAPLSGRIRYAGGDRRIRFGYVPQRAVVDEMFPLTVHEVVLMGRYGLIGPGRRPSADDSRIARQQLAHVGIGELAEKRFRDLSGGQKQRTLVARALAADARLLLVDEPTDGMDVASQQAMLSLITGLRREMGISVVYVTHRLNELANSAQRLLLLHDGKIRVGDVDELMTPTVLGAVYGARIAVEMVDGKRVVLT